MEPWAAAIESVNTIVNDDGRLTALNTDYEAVAALLDRHAVDRSAYVQFWAGRHTRRRGKGPKRSLPLADQTHRQSLWSLGWTDAVGRGQHPSRTEHLRFG